jgi:hypothetical protein
LNLYPSKKPREGTERVVQVEDDRTGMSIETLKRSFADNLFYIQGKDPLFSTTYDYYMALSYTVRDRLIHRWMKTVKTYLEQDVISSSANCLRYYASLLVIGFSPLPITYYQLPAYATV